MIAAILIGLALWLTFQGGDPEPPTADTATPITEIVQVVATNTAAPPTETPPPTSTTPPTEIPTATPIPRNLGPETTSFGNSANGQPLEAVRLGDGPQVILLVGGLHAGFAPASVEVVRLARNHLEDNLDLIPENVTVYLIENINPDSEEDPGELPGRLNGNGVDLNRNWGCDWVTDAVWRNNPINGGAEPFSEPEVQALRDFILDKQARAVIFWEARATNGLVSPGGCEEVSKAGIPLAEQYSEATGYPSSDFGDVSSYDVNGDVTNWLDEQGIPSIAVLLKSYTEPDWQTNKDGIESVIAWLGKQ